MHVHTYVRARAPSLAAAAAGRRRRRCRAGSGTGSGPGPGLGLGLLDSGSDLSLSSLPGLVLFEPRSRSCCKPIGLPTVAHLLDCQRLRTC